MSLGAQDPAEPRYGAPVPITVDGVPAEARPGQTVAAVLLSRGQQAWRTTRGAGKPRGVFCGIGACFDCLVTVNGVPDVRACQRTVRAGDAIRSQAGAELPEELGLGAGQPGTSGRAGPAPGEPKQARAGERGTGPSGLGPGWTDLGGTVQAGAGPGRVRPGETEHLGAYDVLVVGAGPAGLAAALAAADAGVSVGLVDAGRSVGGQYHRQLPPEFAARRPERLQHGWRRFAAVRDRVERHPGITQLPETTVWAYERADDRHRLWVQTGPADAPGRRVRSLDAAAVVLATGAFDRVLPFPGWDLPGVYSAGAAQALAKGQRIAVGRRVVVAGTGPFLLPVAESLLGVGAEVAGVFEANLPGTILRGWLRDPLVARGKLGEAAGYAGLVLRQRVPYRTGWTVVAAHGEHQVEAVTLARLDADWRPIPGSERRLAADAVCLGFGFTAQLELAVAARCDLTTGPDGGRCVVVDDDQQTTVPGVYAAGELTGVAGAAPAAAEGRLAGRTAARSCADQRPAADQARSRWSRPGADLDATRRSVAEGKRFADVLAAAYPVRVGWREWSDGGTVVCRCEEVTRGELEQAAAERELEWGRALRLSSRAGLGLCQGRTCSRTVAALTGDEVAADHRRPVAVPVRLGDLADSNDLPVQEDQ